MAALITAEGFHLNEERKSFARKEKNPAKHDN